MGLESVELVMRMEDEFSINIPDHDAARLTTPRLLADYIGQRLGEQARQNEPHCRTQAHFYWLRANLVEQLGLARRAIRPDTALNALLAGDLRGHWQTLRRSAVFRSLPALRAPAYAAYAVLLAPLTAGLAGYAQKWSGELTAIVALCAWVLAERLKRHLASRLPESLKTVSDLLPYIGFPQRGEQTPNDILQRVIALSADQLGIPVESIQPDHRFVQDLGVD
jgi:acyl carrier protein